MGYSLVPLDVSTTTAKVWVGAFNESLDPAELSLESNVATHPLNPQWESWVSQKGNHRLDYQRVTLTGLGKSRSYSLKLKAKGEIKADADLTTLPEELPAIGEKPFTVLLGSCFCERQDAAGTVGKTYSQLPTASRPELKILCGDQVYLDSPWWRYSLHAFDAEELEEDFFENYQRTWRQSGTLTGFQELLRSGANYFTSDDHEYWNNAPNAAVYVRDTWTEQSRQEWWDLARHLYQTFQPTGTVASFSVGALSFFLADTRVNRKADLTDFMDKKDLEKLTSWIESLHGPGVLVVGQPLFSEPAGFMGRFKDWTLPNFKQYAPLARLIASSKHSIVLLTGDVHFGRIARCALKSGADLIEVISSPLALVDKSAGGEWEAAPAFFPALNIPGLPKAPIHTEESFSLTENHFLTLEFAGVGARVQMTVRAWPILRGGGSPRTKVTYQRWLQ